MYEKVLENLWNPRISTPEIDDFLDSLIVTLLGRWRVINAMEGALKRILCVIVIFLLAGCASAESLVISSKLYIDYQRPDTSLHTEDTILFKYHEWSFSHSVVGPQTFYNGIDLTGLEHDYIESLFVKEKRISFLVSSTF